MHELSIAAAIIDRVVTEMRKRHLTSIAAVGIRVGVHSGVDSDALVFSYTAATIDSPLADSDLIVESVPANGYCLECDHRFRVEERTFLCPSCHSRAFKIVNGDTLQLAYIET